MKAAIFTLAIFTCTAFATQAQTKTSGPVSADAGYGKYTEVQPISYGFTENKKKIRLTSNPKRLDPVQQQQPQLAQESDKRIEGKLAEATDLDQLKAKEKNLKE